MLSSIDPAGDWMGWKVSAPTEILTPQASYECADLTSEPSKIGDVKGRVRQMRDPAVFEEDGKVYLFYTICGEQGIAGAEVLFPRTP